jgi:hypothetical protein
MPAALSIEEFWDTLGSTRHHGLSRADRDLGEPQKQRGTYEAPITALTR